jgi:hypothetical protein
MPVQGANTVSLADAVERYQRLPGAYGNAYDWYRRSAARYGQVSLGVATLSAWKQGRQWMLDAADVEQALAAHEERIAERKRVTEDYAAHVLHAVDGASAETDWGGYRVRRDFHFAWSDYARMTQRSSGCWYCNTCFTPVQEEHSREECHTCRDWGGCGQDCTLSGIYCPGCGTSLDI